MSTRRLVLTAAHVCLQNPGRARHPRQGQGSERRAHAVAGEKRAPKCPVPRETADAAGNSLDPLPGKPRALQGGQKTPGRTSIPAACKIRKETVNYCLLALTFPSCLPSVWLTPLF